MGWLTETLSRRVPVRTIVEELRLEGRSAILLVVGGGWALSLGTRFVFPSLLSDIQTAFGLDLTIAGLLISLLWFAYALGQFPGGVLGDRVGEGRVLLVSTGLAMAMVLLVTVATSRWMLFLATALFGATTALYGPTRFTILSDIYAERDGIAVGFVQAAGDIGSAVLPVVAGLCAVYLSWRVGFGFLIPLYAVVFFGLWRFVPRRTSGATSAVDELSRGSVKYVVDSMRQRAVLIVTAIQVFRTFTYHSFTGFYPTYLVVVKDLDQSTAVFLFSLFFAMGVVVQPTSGASNDRFGPKSTLVVALGISSLAFLGLPFVFGLYPLVVMTVLVSILSAVTPITQTYLTNALPTDMQGTGLGAIRTVFILLGSSGPLIVGSLADRGLFDEAFMLLGALLTISLTLSFFVPPEE